MKLSKNQQEALNELLGMAKYINIYQEISNSLKDNQDIDIDKIANKYQVSKKKCINVLLDVIGDTQD